MTIGQKVGLAGIVLGTSKFFLGEATFAWPTIVAGIMVFMLATLKKRRGFN